MPVTGDMSAERVLDAQTWPAEAEAAIGDIRRHVRAASVSSRLRSHHRIYINLTTLEDHTYCIEMSAAGFRVVGRKYDDVSLTGHVNYETPYALLNNISQKYKESFGDELMTKLLHLAGAPEGR